MLNNLAWDSIPFMSEEHIRMLQEMSDERVCCIYPNGYTAEVPYDYLSMFGYLSYLQYCYSDLERINHISAETGINGPDFHLIHKIDDPVLASFLDTISPTNKTAFQQYMLSAKYLFNSIKYVTWGFMHRVQYGAAVFKKTVYNSVYGNVTSQDNIQQAYMDSAAYISWYNTKYSDYSFQWDENLRFESDTISLITGKIYFILATTFLTDAEFDSSKAGLLGLSNRFDSKMLLAIDVIRGQPLPSSISIPMPSLPQYNAVTARLYIISEPNFIYKE